MALMIFLIALLTLTVQNQVWAACPSVCACAAEPAVCPPGVSAVPDGCACCKVCAAQLNEDCGPALPCDHHKGLECNYGNDVTLAWGICTASKEGRACEYSGAMFQHGQTFRAGCKHQCTCIDGAVGCGPLCANRLPPATPSCPRPRLARVPGQCCLSLDCHGGTWRLPQPKTHTPYNPALVPPPPHPDLNRLDDANDVGRGPGERGRGWEERGRGWEDQRGYNHLPVWQHPQQGCVAQTTDWSPCSRSCGVGVSSRITNDNARCKMERETRICTVRPCGSHLAPPRKKGRKCSSTHKSPEPVRLSYGECRSARLYRPNYCGVCTDGRCCSPRRTRTLPVTFVCPDGERFRRSAMFIRSCKCGGVADDDGCGHLNEAALPPQRWMYGDTHKFID